MQLVIIFIFIVIIFMCCISKRNNINKEDELNDIDNHDGKQSRNIFYSILLFIPLFIMYYILVAFISLIPLSLIVDLNSGGWAYGILLGYVLSPVLTIITIAKMNKNKKLK